MNYKVCFTVLLAFGFALLVGACGNEKQESRQANAGVRKCAVCGRTNLTNPELDFRYCSRCAGYHCFCSDHIFSHVHFTDDAP